MAETIPLYEVSDLVVAFPGFTLGPVSFSISSGSFLTVVGPNGSGKTTLARSLLGLQVPTSGVVVHRGADPAARTADLSSSLAYVTDSSLDVLKELTIEEYWQYCRAARRRGPVPQDRMRRNALELAERLDLPVSRKALCDLSLGTRRKAQIIAALMTEPEVIVVDELFSGLDFLAARALESILAQLWRKGLTVISISHDLELTSRVSTHVALLHQGELVFYRDLAAIGGASHIEDTIVTSLEGLHG